MTEPRAQLNSFFPKFAHSTFWNRVRWTKKNTFPKLTQSTEHDCKKNGMIEFWKRALQLFAESCYAAATRLDLSPMFQSFIRHTTHSRYLALFVA